MDNEMRNKLADAFESVLCSNGISVSKGNTFIDCDDEDVEVGIKCNECFDKHMAVYVIEKMIKEGKLKFSESFEGEKPLDDDIKYLKKLLKIGDEYEI